MVQIENGHPSYSFYREGVADRDYTVDAMAQLLRTHATAHGPGILNVGSLLLIPPENEKVLALLQAARSMGWTISMDINMRPQVAQDLPAYLAGVKALMAQADWLKASDEDMQLLGWTDVHRDQPQVLAKKWQALGCQRVALTFGEQGASLHIGDHHAQAAAPKVQVVDTVGAGDTFWGSCLADWVMHDTVGQEEAAVQRTEKTLQRALRAAAINCERVGCQPPSGQELTGTSQAF
jgi:fructokinase